MLSRRLPRLSLRRSRRAIAAVVLAAYLLSMVGFPVPLPAGKDVSTPFPCQGHACGCHTARQCWESCCCFTPGERLAWAREHDVHLPRDVRLALASQTCDDDEHPRSPSCCSHGEPHAAHADDGCGACDHEPPRTRVGFAFGFQAQKCQGLTTLWTTTGVTVPVAVDALWEFQWVQVGRVCPTAREFSSPFSRPPVPPPRAIADAVLPS